VIFATDDMIEKRPTCCAASCALVQDRGVHAGQQGIHRALRDADARHQPGGGRKKSNDAQMPSFSADGAWNPKAIEVIRNSLKELGFCRRCRPRRIFITTSSCR